MNMRAQRTQLLCFLLLIPQAAAIALMWRAFWMPGMVVCFGLVGAVSGAQFKLARERRLIGALLLLFPFLIHWKLNFTSVYPRVPVVLNGQAVGLGPVFAEYFLLLQAWLLFLERPKRGYAPFMALLAALTFSFAGDSVTREPFYQYASLGFVALLGVLFAEEGNWRRNLPMPWFQRLICAVLIAAALAAGWGSALFLRTYVNDIDQVLARMTMGAGVSASVGFSRESKLGSIHVLKTHGEEQVALRIVNEGPPGYLRGMAHDTYEGARWKRKGGHTKPVPVAPGLLEEVQLPRGWRTFRTGPGDPATAARMDVYCGKDFGGAVFVRQETVCAALPIEQLFLDYQGIAQAEQGTPPHYALFPASVSVQEPPNEQEQSLYTAPPAELDPRIRDLAERVFEGCGTDLERIAAVTRHFHEHYEYSLGIRVPRSTDPLTYFLLGQPLPSAHCEYFATGAAVLLRLSGVPTRYVTGFVAAERNEWGGFWVARNRDAHAWVEAYDRDNGAWVLVEATPSSGVPFDDGSRVSGLWDGVHFSVRRAFAYLVDSIPRALNAAAEFIRRNAVVLAALLLMVLLAAGLLGVLRLRRRRSKDEDKDDPLASALKALLVKMDERLRRFDLVRGRSETIRNFRGRLSGGIDEPSLAAAVVRWYAQYEALRYSPRTDQEAVDALRRDDPFARD